MRRKLVRTFLCVALIGLPTSGCAGVDTSGVTPDAVVPLDQASLADAAANRVVGIGEATHGNKEFVEARTLIIQKLVRDHGFRTVALEADFGGAAAANDYVMKGRGSALDAVRALGFDIYRTREMSNLIQWIHDHNAVVPDADKVCLYGFDMQRYDLNKERLLRYLALVDPDRVRPVEESLAALTDATRSEQDQEKVAAAATAAERLVAQMKGNREKYVRSSTEESFVLAVHHAETIERGAQLQISGNDYARKRDFWMAENVRWIADAQGRKKIILGGHNGHIDKSGAAFAYESMGRLLAKAYGEDYFTIGTDFGTSTFVSKDDDSGERKQFTVSHDPPLAKLFGDEPLGYVNIAQASLKPGNRRLLTSEVPMGNVGDGFRSIYSHLSWTYTVKMVPAKAYDALVYAPRASPVTPL
ncbi:erythromycin esterase family protein [Nonomuraea sediminis]|uniref:erythromycin esterase family protein n=1 Tax=Nonomuraea sediminis TaxID=2835864 RepID=UPI001BDCFC88|nr:erythromycin esterase family protein [Nonomuraea sediminis]